MTFMKDLKLAGSDPPFSKIGVVFDSDIKIQFGIIEGAGIRGPDGLNAGEIGLHRRFFLLIGRDHLGTGPVIGLTGGSRHPGPLTGLISLCGQDFLCLGLAKKGLTFSARLGIGKFWGKITIG